MKKLFALLLLLALVLTLTGCPPQDYTPTNPSPSNPPSATREELKVHFIDVGQADCILLESCGEFALIDGGNVEDSSLVVSYLQKQGVEELEAVFCSHAHEDHVGGLPGVLAVFPTKAVYAPTRTYSSKCFDDFVYYTDQQGLTIQIPGPAHSESVGMANISVLGPVKSYADPNNTSLVLLVTFRETSFLFTGDMEIQAENDMLEFWGDRDFWDIDVLKVGHHGSDTSTGYRFLNTIMPEYGVISVGAGNSYGHPHELPLSRLRDADVTLYRTDLLGNILVTSDGKNLEFTWEKGSNQPQNPEEILPDPTRPSEEEDTIYIGNKNSKKLHLPTCSSLPKESNRVEFASYEEAIAAGYTPCGICMK